jgi:hypothetical protein
MRADSRSILMRTAAVVFVGPVPALSFSILWKRGLFLTGQALVYGPVRLGSVACVSYTLFESSLRPSSLLVVGVSGTAAMVALVGTMLLPIGVWLSPGTMSAMPLGELAKFGVFAAMPLCTVVTPFAWARRASRGAATDASGRAWLSMMASISVSLLAPILTHTTVSH